MNTKRLKIGAAIVLLSPFVPQLFQGEEWGASSPFLYFTDHQDIALGKAVTEGRAREFEGFGWTPDELPDPQAVDTFEQSKLRWDELTKAVHAEIRQWHMDLIALRRAEPAFRCGRQDFEAYLCDDDAMVMRTGDINVVVNLGTHTLIDLGHESTEILLGSSPGVELEEGVLSVTSESVAVVRVH